MKPKSTLRSFLALASSSLLAMSSANAATIYWDGTSATWNDVANWSTLAGATTPNPGALPLVTDDLIFNITGANSDQNITLDAAQAARSLTFNSTGSTNIRGNSSGTTARTLTLGSGGIILASGAGPVTIGEAPATYGAVNITMSAGQTWKSASTGLLSINGDVNNGGFLLSIGDSTNNGSVSIGGIISGSGGITMVTKTRLVLSGANEFTGAVTLSGFSSGGAGTIAFTSIADFGVASALGKAASGSISLGAGSNSQGRLEYIGTSNSESNRTIAIVGTGTNAGQILNNGTGTLTFDATNFNTNNGTSAHSLLLSGSNTGNNTISGIISNGVTSGTNALSLNKTGAGTWILSGANSYTGATTASGTGKLVLSGANTPGASTTSLADGGELVLDYSSQNNTKIGTGALTLNGGTVTLTGGSLFAQTVASTSLGAGGTFIMRSSGTNTLNLGAFTAINRGSSLSISADNVATTDRTNTNGILGGNFVVGDNWAVNSTNGAAGAIVGLSSYTPMVASGAVSTTNYSLTGSLTLTTAASTVNSLKIIASADGQTLDVNTRNLTPTNIGNSAGFLFTAGGNGYTYNITGTAILRTATANQDTFFFVNDGTLNVTADVGSGTGMVVKAGSGTLILGGDSSVGANWSGATRVNQGTLRLTNSLGAGTTAGGIIVQNLAALELANSVAIGAEALTITGTGVSNAGALRNIASNTSSYAGAITIGVDGARINSDATGINLLTLTGGVVTAADRNVTFGGAGNTTVSTAAISGAGGLIKDGAGTTTLSFANTYTGATTVSAGKLLINGSTSSTSLVNVGVNGTLGGTGTVGGNTTISGTHNPGNSPGIQTFSGNLSYVDGGTPDPTVNWELANNTTTVGVNPTANFDQIIVGGNLDFTDITTINLSFNGAGSGVLWSNVFWDSNQSWTLYDVTGTTTNFANLNLNTINWLDSGSNLFSTTGGSFSLGQSGQDVVLNYTVVPEPRAALLGGLGMLMLLRRRR